jgi:hypothetical protein
MQQIEETLRMQQEQINVLSQQGSGPSQRQRDADPALDATPSQRKSSVASTELPADDDAVMLAPRYPVDDITESCMCELHVKVVNISMKVAVGYVVPSGPRPTYHCRAVPDGYAVVGVDECVKGFEELKLDFPAGEGDLNELGEAIKGTVLWRKEYIMIPNWKPRQTPPPLPQPSPARQQTPPRQQSQSSPPHQPSPAH